MVGPVGVPLVGFVMADDASSDRTDLAMPRQMARDTTDDGAFDASLCLGGRCKGDTENGGTKNQQLHGGSPERPVVATPNISWGTLAKLAIGTLAVVALTNTNKWDDNVERYRNSKGEFASGLW